MNAIVPRTTVTQICAHRRRALELYEQAHAALISTDAIIGQAKEAIQAASNGVNRFNYHIDGEKAAFLHRLKVPEQKDFMTLARKIIDTEVWAHVVALTDLERLMDKKAKDDLTKQLTVDPPEATEENIIATVRQMLLDADMIFKRGIAECFSALDRRFRSHDGWKLGSRVILNSAFNEYGSWNYHRNQRDTLQDIERTFFVLEGLPPPLNYGGIVGAVESERSKGWGRRQSECSSEFFTIRCYKNGNAHVWFRRDDLVDKANQLLAEYYGAVIPEEREPDKDTGLHEPKTSLAKNYGFFPTPSAAAETLIENVPLWQPEGSPPLTVLEPSAGTGNLVRLALHKGAIVDCVEIQPALCELLRPIARRLYQMDFLALQPREGALYDRVIMNPPFDRERDIDHVMHALKFLKPDGFLAAIMSAGTEFRDTRKSIAFRELMAKMNAQWRDLPARSFSEVGTNVNTLTLRVWKDGRRFW